MKIKNIKLPTLPSERVYSSAFFLVEAMIGTTHVLNNACF